MPDAVITTQQMFEMLRNIENTLNTMVSSLQKLDERVADHEARLRSIEKREDLSRRVGELEDQLDTIQQRVWAFPSLAGVGALIAIVMALVALVKGI